MKIYVAIAGSTYYPSSGTGDWKCVSFTKDEAVERCNRANEDWRCIVEIDTETGDYEEVSYY